MTVNYRFFTPVKDGSYYVMPSVRLSVCPSICPSINFSCLLHNSITLQHIFMNLGTNMTHHQTMCREQEPHSTYIFRGNNGPLKFFLRKLCLLYSFETSQNIFMKLCKNINHHVQRKRTSTPHTFFTELYPFEIFSYENRVSSITLIP